MVASVKSHMPAPTASWPDTKSEYQNIHSTTLCIEIDSTAAIPCVHILNRSGEGQSAWYPHEHAQSARASSRSERPTSVLTVPRS